MSGAGLDCAEFGEDWSVLTGWESGSLEHLAVYKEGLDPVQLAVWASGHLNAWGTPPVAVDATGVGSGTYGKLSELGHRAERVMAGSWAREGKLFSRLNAEMAWRLREAFQREEAGISKSLPQLDRLLLGEFSAFRYTFGTQGRIRLLKEETKRMLGHSPDLADSAILGFSKIGGHTGRPLVGGWFHTPGIDLEAIEAEGDFELAMRGLLGEGAPLSK